MLRLELTDPGFDASVLSEFRGRLLAGWAESLLFETLLAWSRDRQLINARGHRSRRDLAGLHLCHPAATPVILPPTTAQQDFHVNRERPVGARPQQAAPHLVAGGLSVIGGERAIRRPR